MEIAEEHQAQPVALRADRHAQHAVAGLRAPRVERLRDVVRGPQPFEPFGLALAGMRGECREAQQIGLGRQREQFVERQRGAGSTQPSAMSGATASSVQPISS